MMADAAPNETLDRPTVSEFDDLSEAQRLALHEVELGIERIHRAHGHLVTFHHNTGRAMDHLADAESLLRECGYPRLADSLRDEYLPRGVITDVDSTNPNAGRWSYDLLENFQRTFFNDIVTFGDEIHESVANGVRHAFERQQERDWKNRTSIE